MKHAISDLNGPRPGKGAISLDHLDVATHHGAREIFRDVLDHVLFARDQGGPIELRLADGDLVLRSPFNVVKRLSGGDQHLFWGAATIGTGAAEVARLDHRDR